MKNRNFFSILLVTLLAPLVWAQDDEKISLQFSDPGKKGFIESSVLNGSIEVKGVSGSEIRIWAENMESHDNHRRGNRESRGKASGLRRINKRAFGLTVEERNNHAEVEVNSIHQSVKVMMEVPYNTSLKLSCVNGGNINVENVNGDLEINNVNGGVNLTDVSGSVVAHALNHDLIVTMTEVTPGKAMSFSSLNGKVDVTLPSTIDAVLKMETQQGEIFTDFDLKLESRTTQTKDNRRDKGGKYRVSFEKAIYGTINNGGPEIVLKSLHGDIFIRKGGT